MRLGHSKITTTMDRYGHLMPELDETLVDLLDERFADDLKVTRISSLGER